MTAHPPLGEREAFVLGKAGEALSEFGEMQRITRDALAYCCDGPIAGSVAVLVSLGLLRRWGDTDEGPELSITDDGRKVLALELIRQRNGRIIVPRGVNGA